MADDKWFKEAQGIKDEQNVDELLQTINGLLGLSGEERLVLDHEEDKPGESVGVNLKKYDPVTLKKQGFWDSQIAEITKGLEANLPVDVYAYKDYNWMQMYELRMGLVDGLPVEAYMNTLFNSEQMHEIRMGLFWGIDVSSYAKYKIASNQMKQTRRSLIHDKYNENPTGFERTIKDDNSGVEIYISDDCMEARLKITAPADKKYTVKELTGILEKNEVTYGVIQNNLTVMLEHNIRDKFVPVAKGTPSEEGKPGKYEIYFKGELPESPKILPDGRVDYTNVVVAQMVEPGMHLVQYYPASLGVKGTTVTGITVEGKRGDDLPALQGSGIRFDHETNSYFATARGYASYNQYKYTLNIWPTYIIHGDANCYNGNIIFDGNVYVQGSVMDMTCIKVSGDIVVDGYVAGATLVAGQNIIIKGGVNMGFKGSIQADGKIMSSFYESACLKALGPIEGNYFLNCIVETDDKVLARGNKGRIMGGNIIAAAGVESANISNAGAGKMLMNIGDVYSVENKLKKCEILIKKTSDEIEKLETGIDRMFSMMGADTAKRNAIFSKTDEAVTLKKQELERLEGEHSRLKSVREKALAAYVRVYGELQSNISMTICGAKKEIMGTVYNVTLTKEKSKTPFNHKPPNKGT
ncbi:MAG: FapA family protein [Lachnospiraceae bacterium]|nr:FapA family protein [Lachnospiraceae bacterium]